MRVNMEAHAPAFRMVELQSLTYIYIAALTLMNLLWLESNRHVLYGVQVQLVTVWPARGIEQICLLHVLASFVPTELHANGQWMPAAGVFM